ncbi:MAG: TIGR00341 family protein [Pseudomonadota bacterium]
MSYRILQLHVENSHEHQLKELLKDSAIVDYWQIEKSPDMQFCELLVKTSDAQKLTDKVETFMGNPYPADTLGMGPKSRTRLVSIPVSAVWPRTEDEGKKTSGEKSHGFSELGREELYNEISRGTEVTSTFFALVILSTIVAAIGLIEDNVAVIIGAMVIAPLLGPNLALALATALGDTKLMSRAIFTNVSGLIIVLILGYIVGFLWPYTLEAEEIISRTQVTYGGIILAIASGAAGVLSLLGGVAAGMVGVMVAVALLPPATVTGLMLGAGNYPAAMGATLLLVVNIVCINLSAKLVFLVKGIRPRQWFEQKRAGQAMFWYILFWTITLVVLAGLIALSKDQPDLALQVEAG